MSFPRFPAACLAVLAGALTLTGSSTPDRAGAIVPASPADVTVRFQLTEARIQWTGTTAKFFPEPDGFPGLYVPLDILRIAAVLDGMEAQLPEDLLMSSAETRIRETFDKLAKGLGKDYALEGGIPTQAGGEWHLLEKADSYAFRVKKASSPEVFKTKYEPDEDGGAEGEASYYLLFGFVKVP